MSTGDSRFPPGMPVWDLKAAWHASKNKAWHETQLLITRAIAGAFDEHSLAVNSLVERLEREGTNLVIRFADLTNAGQDFFLAHFNKWLASHDRWERPVPAEKYRATLEKRIRRHFGDPTA
jgi:hypothetical protein